MYNFYAILVSQVRCYCNLYLLSFIVTMYWTKCLFELYSNSRVLIRVIILFYFFVSIIGCHNCSYSAILIVFCTFKFSSMTLSLSPSFVCIGYCAIELRIISFMVFIKQLKPMTFVQCTCCYTDLSLAFQGEGCGFESPPWDWKFFSSFLYLHFFPSFPYTARLPSCMRVYGQVPVRLSGGPSYHRLRP